MISVRNRRARQPLGVIIYLPVNAGIDNSPVPGLFRVRPEITFQIFRKVIGRFLLNNPPVYNGLDIPIIFALVVPNPFRKPRKIFVNPAVH